MEKMRNLTSRQEEILKRFSENSFLRDVFYFTGGTALSSVYLQHRYSDDLDFFSQTKFDNFALLTTVQTWAKELKASLSSRVIENVHNFELVFFDGYSLKLDFAQYPYKNIDKFLLQWKNLLKERIGEEYYPFIEYKVVRVNEKFVLWVECKASSSPCYLDQIDFYVRTNPATDKLEGPKLVEYVKNHFLK